MDRAKMIAEIAARHHVRLDADDPAFLLVDLNLMALEEGAAGLDRWKTDAAALVGALEQNSKKWQDNATVIAQQVFKGQMDSFIQDTTREKERFLGEVPYRTQSPAERNPGASSPASRPGRPRAAPGRLGWGRCCSRRSSHEHHDAVRHKSGGGHGGYANRCSQPASDAGDPFRVEEEIAVLGALGLFVYAAGLGFLAWEGMRGLFRRRSHSWWFVPPLFIGLIGCVRCYQATMERSTLAPSDAGWLAGFLGLLVVVWFTGRRRARNDAKGDLILRGSELASARDQMMAMYGHKAAMKSDFAGFIRLGDVALPWEIETQHLLFSGTTGSGKTQAINRVLRVVRERSKRALVADSAGGFLSRFCRPGDLIFNPFDARSVDWSPFAEIRAEYDCSRIAKAAIPDVHGDAQEWHHYAQTLLSETMLAMHKQGQHSIKQLLYYLTIADTKELAGMLAGTPAAILCVKGNDKMLSNTRGIISTYLIAWRYLRDDGRFSVRDWVRNEGSSSWLFVTFRDDQIGMLRSLVATMLELGIVEGLSLSEDPWRDLWFVMDEVDSLGKITSLRAGLTRLRKYGCKCVLGLQTISQLRSTYGDDEAQTLLANVSTKAVLRAGDGETAEYFSKEFGEQEIERRQWSSTTGSSSSGLSGGSSSESTSLTDVRETKRTILASEISTLHNLRGFLKLPGAPISRLTIDYEELPDTAPAYVEKNMPRLVPAVPANALRFGTEPSYDDLPHSSQ